MHDKLARFKYNTLGNGLNLYSLYTSKSEWQLLTFVVHSGSNHDLPDFEGTAHFLEHMVNCNAKLSAEKMFQFFKAFGGSANLGETSSLHTVYDCKFPAKEPLLQEVLSLWEQRLLQVLFTKALEKERRIILREHSLYFLGDALYQRENEYFRILANMASLPPIHSSLGSVHSINNIGYDQLQQFHNQHYQPSNMSIVAIGGMKNAQLMNAINESRFSSSGDGFRNIFNRSDRCIKCPTPQFVIHDKKSGKTATNFNINCLLTGLIKPQLQVFMQVLNLVLMAEIREKRQLAYEINASSHLDFPDLRRICIQSSSYNPNKVNRLHVLMQQCIEKALNNRVLFEKTRANIVAGLANSERSNEQIMNSALSYVFWHDHIVPIATLIEQQNNLQFETMQALAPQLRPELMAYMIVNP